ncbi:hypothetical protein AFIC_000931 [[Pseudomonas] carboxydohydrogena]|uniref:Uncharacterized protein n=1 Tax=Afipia carboxydohydrogena TaxID=290 RepID=A0ABY8BR65_AFICR|nr:hypothetical protein AFIC_000931 [[Pseudomonas] carboxydohydrogena]
MTTTLAVTICALMAAPAAVLAQAAPAPATPQAPIAPSNTDRPATKCAPTQVAPGESGVQPSNPKNQAGKPLGDTLAKSDGVLCPPPGIDPEMHAPTPNPPGGSMPVIPPPGSPGGDPNVRPK